MKGLLLALAGAAFLCAQAPVDRAWSILQSGAADKSPETRMKAVRALGLIQKNDKSRQMAEKALTDESPQVREAAAEALGKMGAKESADKLVEIIRNPKEDAQAVFAATAALSDLGDPRAYGVYYAVLTGERKTGESLISEQMKMLKDKRQMAQMAFEQGIGFVPFAGLGYSAFKQVTKDDVSPVRAAAAAKLANDPDPKTAEALEKSASDPKWLVRAAVVNAIAKRGDPALVKALVPLLDDKNDVVQYNSAAALIQLSK
jgi:HEAT repeat protein